MGTASNWGEVESAPEAIDRWVSELTRRFGSRRIAVQPRGSGTALLPKYSQLVAVPR
jgi:hypothetical protein